MPIAILLIGLASLVLGMGVPVTAAYLITAVLAVGAVSEMISQTQFGMSFRDLEVNPELVRAGYAAWALLASHMIVYWFSQDSNITPPVCVAAYAGAAIAGSDPWKTGWTSFKFAKMLYIGPFLFAFRAGFPAGTGDWYDIVLAYMTITLGTIAFGSLTMGYMLVPHHLVRVDRLRGGHRPAVLPGPAALLDPGAQAGGGLHRHRPGGGGLPLPKGAHQKGPDPHPAHP